MDRHATTVEQVRAALEARIAAAGVELDRAWRALFVPRDPPIAADYSPRTRMITYYRNDPHQPDDGDAIAELHVIAHELGHALSHQRGERTEDYEAAVKLDDSTWKDVLTTAQKASVLDEEARAWRYAAELLAELGAPAGAWGLAERTATSLARYRAVLSVDGG